LNPFSAGPRTEGDATKLCTANVGDARIVLVRDGQAVQMSVDHVPDDENERRRIDRGNPNLRKSMVGQGQRSVTPASPRADSGLTPG